MRLYATVAVLTFLGCFAVFSATQMTGVANAIGGSGAANGTSYAALFWNFNPLTLLQRERVQAIASSGDGIPRVEAFRTSFNASDTIRALQQSKVTFETRRAWLTSQYRPIKVPTFQAAPVYRPYR